MDKAIDGGQRHSLVGKDLAPFAKWLIGCDQHGSPLVTRGDPGYVLRPGRRLLSGSVPPQCQQCLCLCAECRAFEPPGTSREGAAIKTSAPAEHHRALSSIPRIALFRARPCKSTLRPRPVVQRLLSPEISNASGCNSLASVGKVMAFGSTVVSSLTPR